MATNTKIAPKTTGKLPVPRVVNLLMLFIWIAAAVGIILPFALGTSPLDALLLKVPNNEGNWWHALVGLPFFLTLPMIGLHLYVLNSSRMPTLLVRRILWIAITFSAMGTLLVETPFLLHRAGTSELQRMEVIFLGIGIILGNGFFLFINRKKIHGVRALFIGITAAYLANAFLCLIVYGEAKFQDQSRSGWYLTLVIVMPILVEMIWHLFRKPGGQKSISQVF